uniref:Ribonuclease VapC n=1 Tax=Candidatus Kentrum sp. FM TaxID=2126340 RepID=A0A450VMU6_9GAMM|nr:MAG: PIN domain nuclease, a component of toxin-antitoxin system (PIN domain) [Candidatus Kentron sp. FM]VFJ43951.1 MAG: PIN domain nuclease, a component of toxin-antitoxin system (PIN domain) [Candidatus Kentron sp. FM]VFK06027.1 MAG: PIN domain nuclease, a component of toxin-antitoxin system (PIN domain) [Candidatus Kentron sp. FM]
MIVLDSHIWFWWINQEQHRLPASILEAIKASDRIGVSPASCFELALAHKKSRLELPLPPAEWFPLALRGSDVELLPFDDAIALRAVDLSDIHRDPFDRIIIATALQLNGRLASVDGRFDAYPELADVLLR